MDEFEFLKRAFLSLHELETIYRDDKKCNAAAASMNATIRNYLKFRSYEAKHGEAGK